MTAFRLARSGVRVLLVDKAAFPRVKVCGSCLNARALRELKNAGLGHLTVIEKALRLETFTWMRGGRRLRIPLSAEVGLSRERLDQRLVLEACSAGAEFWDNASATVETAEAGAIFPRKSSSTDGCIRVHVQTPQKNFVLETEMAVIAGGLQGGILKNVPENIRVEKNSYLGAGTLLHNGTAAYPAGTLFMATASQGYCGLVRLEDGRLNMAAAFSAQALSHEKRIPAVIAGILREAGADIPEGLEHAAWKGTPKLSRYCRNPAGRRYFALGDAAGYIEPFTGEGIYWALAQARLLTDLMKPHAFRWHESLADEWKKIHSAFLCQETRTCRAVTPLLRSSFWSAQTFALFERFPRLAAWTARRLNGAVRFIDGSA